MIGTVRRFCQTVRHSPGLRKMDWLWSLLRTPYNGLLRAFGTNHGIPVKVAGYSMRLDPAFASHGWEHAEEATYAAFASAIEPRDVVFDVGTYIGTYTLVALDRLGPHGKVVSYEPQATAREYLQKHLTWNSDAGRVTIRPVCCSNTSGKVTFYCAPGTAESRSGLVPLSDLAKVDVPAVTLDQEVQTLGLVPSVIKIDVEGAEWDVLKGAEQLLLEHHPVLILSLHPPALAQRGESCEALLDWLAARGYKFEHLGVDHEVHVCARP